MLEGCISGSIHFVMMVKEDEGPDRQIHGITRTTILVMDSVFREKCHVTRIHSRLESLVMDQG